MITNNGANGQDVSQQLTMAQQSMNQPGQSNIPAPMSAPNVMNNPLDFLFQAATKDEDTEISLDTLKQSEIDKIMDAYSRCKGVADNYYKSTIRPKLQKREQQYLATEDYYKKRFPVLSETSKFCSRDIKTTIDWMIPSMCEPFIGSDDPVDIKGVNVDDDDKATKIQQLLKYQLQRKNSYPSFINAIWRDALRLNYAVSKVYWKRDEDRERYKLMVSGKDAQIVGMLNNEALKGKIEVIEKKPVKDAPDLSIITFEKIIVKANHPVIQYMSPSELRFTPDGHSVQDAKFKAHRKLVTGDYLKRKEQEGVYQNIDKAIKEFSGDTTYDLFDTDKNKELSTVNERIKDDDDASKMFELYESYMQVDYNNDGIYENLIIHAVGNTPIRIAKNDFDMAPFFIAYAEISPTTAFNENESFTDNILQQQDLKTAVFRQIITNVAKNNSPRTFVNNNVDIDALINNEEIVLCNTSENPASSISTGSQLPISPLSMQIIEYAQNEIESQTGSTRYNQGLDSNSLNKTATGLTAIMGSSEKRMKHMARMFAENFIIPLMKYVILLDQKYLDQEQMIRLADENIIIDKAELDIDYDLIINVGLGAGTREAQIQYLMVLIQQIYPVLAQTGIVTPVSWYEIVKDLLEKMGIRNTENYLIDPNSDVAKQAQQQAAQAQQQAQQQALQLEQAKAQLEIEKARQPHFTIRYEDLPPEAQLQALKYLGIQLNSGDIIQKEQLEYVKKNQKPDAPNIPAAGSGSHR